MERETFMARLKVLVTGNEGYIGSIVTDTLLQRDYEVIGYDSGLFANVAFVSRTRIPFQQIHKDIRDVALEDLVGVSAIIHLAGLSNDPVGELDPALTDEINHQATVHFAEVAKAAGVPRFLFSSSCSMYGASQTSIVDETASFNPQTAYAQSKVDAENGLRKLASDHFSPVFLRNATAFGVSPRLRLDLVVQNLLALGYTTGMIELTSDGTPWRPLVHVNDIADAFAFLLQQPREHIHNQAFNIGRADNNVQVKTIATAVAARLPGSLVSIGNSHTPDTRSYQVSLQKIESLGWKARWSLAAGVRQVHSIFKQRGFSASDVTSHQYITLKRYAWAQQLGLIDNKLRVV